MAPKMLKSSGTMVFKHDFLNDQSSSDSRKIDDDYVIDKEALGEGSYGYVTKGSHKIIKDETGKAAIRAIKAIPQEKIPDEERFKTETRIQQELDHPNIVKLFDVYKDKKKYYLVMEICEGGELFDRIVAEADKYDGEHAFDERKASTYMMQILSAINYLHSKSIAHRDIKPENFLMSTKEDSAEIKVIDFGLAKSFEDSVKMKTKAGTPYYVAPQVLQGSYNEKCDIWSCGVIAYILTCGYPPFYGDSDADILKMVKKGAFDFPSPDWDANSKELKDLIKQMMTKDEDARPSANEILKHPWLNLSDKQTVVPKVAQGFKKNMSDFKKSCSLKKMAMTMIAKQLSDTMLSHLKETFQAMDTNHDGTLTVEEVENAMKELKLDTDGMAELLRAIDTDRTGKIDWTEFVASSLEIKHFMAKDTLWAAFRMFDKDGDEKISFSELKEVFKDSSDEQINKILQEVDKNGDGEISYEEFCDMMGGQK